MRLKCQPSVNCMWYLQLGLGQWGGTKESVWLFMPSPGITRARHNFTGTTGYMPQRCIVLTSRPISFR